MNIVDHGKAILLMKRLYPNGRSCISDKQIARDLRSALDLNRTEFKGILQNLYDNGIVTIYDEHSYLLLSLTTDGRALAERYVSKNKEGKEGAANDL